MQFVSRELWIFLAYFLIEKTHLNFMWEKFTCYSYVNFMSNEYDNFFSSAKNFRIKYVISSTDETNKRKTSGVPRCLCQMIIWFFFPWRRLIISVWKMSSFFFILQHAYSESRGRILEKRWTYLCFNYVVIFSFFVLFIDCVTRL